MNTLHVSLFGKFQIHQAQYPVVGLDARKVQELLCYLLVYKNRSHCREELAALLWGDKTTSHSKKYLRQALWQLQSILNPESDSCQQVLLVDPEWVHVNPNVNIWIDTVEFENAFACVQSILASELDRERVQTLHTAVQLYQGDFLEGWYQDWCIYERERYQSIYLAMQEKLLAYCEAQDDYESGMIHGHYILRYDRAQERTHRRLMRLHYRAGNRTSALRQFQSCVAALDEELGVGPAQSTLELYEQIRSDQLDKVKPQVDQKSPVSDGSNSASYTRNMEPSVAQEYVQLKDVQTTLNILK
ncbi:bacterial transcriptional activator domain-containing protein [Chloroflexi bacterium TSY]|nr:bacterial transcriptional activator domain-containing protein [Chloroflexi bacterium TSY]